MERCIENPKLQVNAIATMIPENPRAIADVHIGSPGGGIGFVDRLERLVGAFAALDTRKVADSAHELVRASRRVACLACLLAHEVRGKDIGSAPKERAEEPDFLCRCRRRGGADLVSRVRGDTQRHFLELVAESRNLLPSLLSLSLERSETRLLLRDSPDEILAGGAHELSDASVFVAAGTYPNPTGFRGDNRSFGQLRSVFLENSYACLGLLDGRKSHEPHDSTVSLPADDRELTEVLIQRDQNTRLVMRATQNLFIAGIRGPVGSPNDIVSEFRERFSHAARDARVEENPQAALPPRAGSTRSCPTRRRA